MKNQLYIQIRKSKKTGLLYWVMLGANNEKLAHSEGIENKTYLKSLMARFEKMGFKILPKK
jgi:O-glycosyl hydrolase